MKPLAHFDAVWDRCSYLSALHAYLSKHVAAVMQPDELLRAEWVARVSALDLFIHECVSQGLLDIFEGVRPPTPAYSKFKITNDTLSRIKNTKTKSEASSAFDLDVRNQLSHITYQEPDKIADGIRLVSSIQLWNEVALILGATATTQNDIAKAIKRDLSLIIERRNKIAHEGDLQPVLPRQPWPITAADLIAVKGTIESIVKSIDLLINVSSQPPQPPLPP